MSKDPAFLFYPNDWSGGTITFNRQIKGAYLDLLVAQFNQGELSLLDIKQVLGADFWMWDAKLCLKFPLGANGLYSNPRLRKEMLRRKLFVDSKKNNPDGKNQFDHGLTSPPTCRTENEIEDENRIPPCIDDVIKYCKERNNGVDANKWHNFYLSKNWMIGKNKMKDWKAAVRTWEKSKEEKKEWPSHSKNCECWGNGYVIAPGSGQRVYCNSKQ